MSPFPLEVCGNRPLQLRRERVGGFALRRPASLLYASDLHMGWPWTEGVASDIAALAEREAPDLILLGGDLVDSLGALDGLERFLRRMSVRGPVAAVPGNHDRALGAARVREAVESGGGTWLEGRTVPCPGTDGGLSVDGSMGAGPAGVPRVLCAHDPAVFPHAARAGYRLVLAGHLHGGQCVAATFRGRLYPGALFSPWHGLRFGEGDATMLVSRGAGDTLPLRWNCPREVVLCELS